MDDWKTSIEKIKELLKSKNLTAAKEELARGLEKIPNQVNLLAIATDVHRALGDREKSLKYSDLLITHHPENWNGYGRAAQDLLALKRFEQAREKIQSGLEKIPNQVNLLELDKQASIYLSTFDVEINAFLQEFQKQCFSPIPIGENCVTAHALGEAGLRTKSLPFDWVVINPINLLKTIESDFNDLMDSTKLISNHPNRTCGHTDYGIPNFYYHHDPSREPDKSAFERRTERLRKMIRIDKEECLLIQTTRRDWSQELEKISLHLGIKVLSILYSPGKTCLDPVIHYKTKNVCIIKITSNHPKILEYRFITCKHSQTWTHKILQSLKQENYKIISNL